MKCVILGQDPYHTPGVADGLAFSTQPSNTNRPPSLRNILSELASDVGTRTPTTSSLVPWTTEGVLLLNTSLTVAPSRPGSHSDLGWWHLVRDTLRYLSDEQDYFVSLLWGVYAQTMGRSVIDDTKHGIICSSHPSPLSAHRGFIGSRPFSKCNEMLIEKGKEPIRWDLP